MTLLLGFLWTNWNLMDCVWLFEDVTHRLLVCAQMSNCCTSSHSYNTQHAGRATHPDCLLSHRQWMSPSVHLSTCLSFIREVLGCAVCSDSCSNSHTCFQWADVFTGASHAYFPEGDAFPSGSELELRWPRHTRWETGGVEWQNTPWPDADGVVCVCLGACICILLWCQSQERAVITEARCLTTPALWCL